MTAVIDYVDAMLKGMGWRRASELRTFPLDEPMRLGSAPNRFAEFDVRRDWRDCRYFAAVRRAIKAQRVAKDSASTRGMHGEGGKGSAHLTPKCDDGE